MAGRGTLQNLFCIGGILLLKFQYLSLHLKHWGNKKPMQWIFAARSGWEMGVWQSSSSAPGGDGGDKDHPCLTRGGGFHVPAPAAARSAAGSAFANAKHTHGPGESLLQPLLCPAVLEEPLAPSEVSDLCAHSPLPQDHPAELSFDAQPMGRLWRYLCTSAAPGRPSAAAGRCSGLSWCSMWTPFSGSEALKTKRGRVDTLPHFSPTGSACLQPLQAWAQCFPEVWSCKVPLWEQGRLPSSAPGFALQSAWPSLPLI